MELQIEVRQQWLSTEPAVLSMDLQIQVRQVRQQGLSTEPAVLRMDLQIQVRQVRRQ